MPACFSARTKARGAETERPYISDRMLRRELEYEESLASEPTYQIVGGEDEGEMLTEDSSDMDDDEDIEE